MISFTAWLAGSVLGAAVGTGWAIARRKFAVAEPWHNRIVSIPVHSTQPVRLPAPTAASLRIVWTPGILVAGSAALSLAHPWGPIDAPLAASLAGFGVAATALGAGALQAVARRSRIRQQFPDWLAFLAAALDLGMPFVAALRIAADAVDAPLAQEAGRLADAAAAGITALPEALDAFAEVVGSPEAHFAVGVLARRQRLGTSVTSTLMEEEGLVTRLKAEERKARQGLLPYAFTASAGVLLLNAVLLFVVPRAAALLASLHGVPL